MRESTILTSSNGHGGGAPTRAELEARIRRLATEVTSEAQDAAPKLLVVVGGVGFVALVLAYLLGRRRGRKRSSVIEIRRI
jgi:hypothetical protein